MADARNYFRWRLGLEHVRPVKKIFYRQLYGCQREQHRVLYCSRRLYAAPLYGSVFEMLNIETGERLCCPRRANWYCSDCWYRLVRLVSANTRVVDTVFDLSTAVY